MFDSVVARGSLPSSRFGAGFIITVVVHAVVIAIAIYLGNRPPEEKKDDVDVKFFAARPPPPPPPPPPAGGGQTPKVETKKVEKKPKKPQEIIQPKEIPQEKPKEAEPQPEPEAAAEPDKPAGVVGGVEGGVEGGTVGGVIGGTVGGTLGGTLGEVLPFGDGMTRPVPSPDNAAPRYTREALEAKIEGTMLVKCIITTEGRLEQCRIVKPLPHMSEAVLSALASWRFAPVMFQGHPVSVAYVIPVHLVMQR